MSRPAWMDEPVRTTTLVNLLCLAHNWMLDVVQLPSQRAADALAEAEDLNDIMSDAAVMLLDASQIGEIGSLSGEPFLPLDVELPTDTDLEFGHRLFEPKAPDSDVHLDVSRGRMEADEILSKHLADFTASGGRSLSPRNTLLRNLARRLLLDDGWTASGDTFVRSGSPHTIVVTEGSGRFDIGFDGPDDLVPMFREIGADIRRLIRLTRERIREYMFSTADAHWVQSFLRLDCPADELPRLVEANRAAAELLVKGIFPYCYFQWENGRLHGSL